MLRIFRFPSARFLMPLACLGAFAVVRFVDVLGCDLRKIRVVINNNAPTLSHRRAYTKHSRRVLYDADTRISAGGTHPRGRPTCKEMPAFPRGILALRRAILHSAARDALAKATRRDAACNFATPIARRSSTALLHVGVDVGLKLQLPCWHASG